MKLLIVDDETRTREMIARQVARIPGIDSVIQAENGAEALRLLEEELPDVILSDIAMPVMNGLEMLESLRSQGSDIPVIIMSGYNDFSFAQQAIRYNAVEYLLKPVNPQELIKTISRVTSMLEEKDFREVKTRQSFLNELFSGNIQSAAIANKQLRILNLPTDAGCFIAGFLHLFREGQYIQKPQEVFSEHQLSNEDPDVTMLLFRRHNRQNTLLFMCRNMTEEKAVKSVSAIMESNQELFLREYRILLSAALSQPYPSLMQLPAAEKEAIRVYRSEISVQDKACLFYRKQSYASSWKDLLPEFNTAEEELIRSIMQNSGDGERLLEKLIAISSRISRQAEEDWNYPIRQLAIRLEGLTSAADESGTAEVSRLLGKIKNAASVLEAAGLLKEAVPLLNEQLLRSSEPPTTLMIRQIREYVAAHLADEYLSVQDVIAGFNYSENYIRYIFSNSEGLSIKEFIIRMRMEKAQELLLRNVPVKEIAEQTGYNNQRYFARAFKDFTGETPSDWREHNIQK